MHYLADVPTSSWRGTAAAPAAPELSTASDGAAEAAVDDSNAKLNNTVWLGMVVPKRHARRSVTRSLMKRQIRAAVGLQAGGLATGLWVVRMRAPFDRKRFVSAASDALRAEVRDELAALVGAAAGRPTAA